MFGLQCIKTFEPLNLYCTKFFCLSVCYHIFCNHAQRDNERAIPKGSVLYRLDFEFGDFRKSNAFESYGVKTSQYANISRMREQISRL